MTIGIMQPYFFPYIGYFQLINAVDKFILYENLNFQNKGWMSRNRLIEKNKSVPVFFNAILNGRSFVKKISETELEKNNLWKQKLIKFIYHNYAGSLYFDEVYSFLVEMISADFQKLHEYNSYIISEICKKLGIKTILSVNNSNYLSLEEDISNLYSDDLEKKENDVLEIDKKSYRIIKICKMENAENYYNAIGGVSLYNKVVFAKYEININFIKTLDYKYTQFGDTFIKDLSIIDVLMHNGFIKSKELLNLYDLI
ncbi:MAG: WbqC family protein [bacterium]